MLQSGGSSMEQFRMRERRNLIGWIQSIEMRDMAMFILRIIRIHKPLLQLSVLSYLHRRNLRNQLLHLLALSLINTQYFRSLHGTGQGIEGYLVIHRATSRYGSFFPLGPCSGLTDGTVTFHSVPGNFCI